MSTASYPGDQFGWTTYTGDGTTQLIAPNETGGLCKSGLRCAVFQSGTLMLLRAVAASLGRPMVMSIAAKPAPDVSCSTLGARIIRCDNSTWNGSLATDNLRDADGWCTYQASLAAMDQAPCLYLTNSLPAGDSMLVDDARLVPSDGSAEPHSLSMGETPKPPAQPVTMGETPKPPAQPAEAVVASPEETERMQTLMGFVRRRMRFGRPPPPAPPRY
jgi:hypothetical protein